MAGPAADSEEVARCAIEFAKARFSTDPESERLDDDRPALQFGTPAQPRYIYYRGELVASFGFNYNEMALIVNYRQDIDNNIAFTVDNLAREFAETPELLVATSVSNRLASQILGTRNFNSPDNSQIFADRLNRLQEQLNIRNTRRLNFESDNSGLVIVRRGLTPVGTLSVHRNAAAALGVYIVLNRYNPTSSNRGNINSQESLTADVRSLLDRLTATDRLEAALQQRPAMIPVPTGGRRVSRKNRNRY